MPGDCPSSYADRRPSAEQPPAYPRGETGGPPTVPANPTAGRTGSPARFPYGLWRNTQQGIRAELTVWLGRRVSVARHVRDDLVIEEDPQTGGDFWWYEALVEVVTGELFEVRASAGQRVDAGVIIAEDERCCTVHRLTLTGSDHPLGAGSLYAVAPVRVQPPEPVLTYRQRRIQAALEVWSAHQAASAGCDRLAAAMHAADVYEVDEARRLARLGAHLHDALGLHGRHGTPWPQTAP